MRARTLFATLIVGLAGAAAGAQPAAALEPGVHVDPGSPSGKEYSFPLSVLRGASVGQTAPQGAPEPLFGVGISPAGAGVSSYGSAGTRATITGRRALGSASSPGSHGRSAATAGSGRPIGSGPRRGRTPAIPLKEAQNLIRPSSPVPQVALIALPLLLAALALGAGIAAVRRRS